MASKYRSDEAKEVPAMSTGSMPDIIFMLIFFFMVTTSMREVSLKVKMSLPEATEVQKLERKSLVSYIYIGPPTNTKIYGTESRIQLNDQYSRVTDVIPYIDYFLMDIKHVDSRKHKEFTGQSNEIILENAKYIAENARHLIIRVPTVPTFNDTPEEIASIARFADSLPNVTELHLLPYHRLGQDKYAGIGREYTLSHIAPPSKEHMEELLRAAQSVSTKLHVQIGG